MKYKVTLPCFLEDAYYKNSTEKCVCHFYSLTTPGVEYSDKTSTSLESTAVD